MLTTLNEKSNFNPIIGLILTHINNIYKEFGFKFQSHYRSDFNLLKIVNLLLLQFNFNPIICLILTSNHFEVFNEETQFQSHYRSDFNKYESLTYFPYLWFQSHYRSDFNTKLINLGTTHSASFQSHYRSDFNIMCWLILN